MNDQRRIGQNYGDAEQLVVGKFLHGGSFLLIAGYGRCRKEKAPGSVLADAGGYLERMAWSIASARTQG